MYLVCCTWLLTTIICLCDTPRKTHSILLSHLPSCLFCPCLFSVSASPISALLTLYKTISELIEGFPVMLTEKVCERKTAIVKYCNPMEKWKECAVRYEILCLIEDVLLIFHIHLLTPLIIPHRGWSSPQSWQGAGRPAGSLRRGARRGWGGWEHKTTSSSVMSPQR